MKRLPLARILLGSLTLGLASGAALADLTAELCGPIRASSATVNSEGVRTTFHIQTVEGRSEPVPHCYVDGWLAGDTRFRIMLPAAAAWNGKYVLGLGGGYGGSFSSNNDVVNLPVLVEGYAVAQSDEGREAPVFDANDSWQELHTIRNHQTTMFAKSKIGALYGRQPSRSYLFGSSGGGWRSLSQLERYPQSYDGAGMRNPAIEPRHLTYTYTILDHFVPVIAAKLPQIIAARDRNETDLPFLSAEERHALDRIYTAGAAAGSEFKFTQAAAASVTLGYAAFRLFDPNYFEDFWSTPGYAGHDGEVSHLVVDGVAGSVAAVGAPNAGGYILSFTQAGAPLGANAIKGWRLTMTSGALEGRHFHVSANTATQVSIAGYGGALNGLAPGDSYVLSNRDFLAWQRYHEHIAQCQYPEYAGDCDGLTPKRPQRPARVQQAYRTRGAELTGRIRKPVVSTAQDLDHLVYPVIISRYFDKVRAVLGDKASDMLRVYWNENHSHGNPLAGEANRMVERDSSWHAAFQYMVQWVEHGTPPPADTVVSVAPGSVTFPAGAAERRGIQPVVSATANGARRIVVSPGTLVSLDGFAESPIGKVARYEWDFEGNSQYDCASPPAGGLPDCAAGFIPGQAVTTPASRVYATPGTYTATRRVHDDTDNPSQFDGLQNLSRVVIVVQ
jgi:hypothetical protein